MPLPVLNTPYYDLTLPISGAKIKYRPFLAKEQKILLIAAESKNRKEIINAIQGIVESCCQNLPTKEPLALVDIETIFLNLRIKSVGETLKANVSCPHCKTSTELEVDLLNLTLKQTPGHTNKFQITEDIVIQMKYPNLETLRSSQPDTDTTVEFSATSIFETLEKSIECVYYGQEKIAFADCTKEEIKNFMESLSLPDIEKLTQFFVTLPSYNQEFKVACSNKECAKEYTVKVDNIYDFFT